MCSRAWLCCRSCTWLCCRSRAPLCCRSRCRYHLHARCRYQMTSITPQTRRRCLHQVRARRISVAHNCTSCLGVLRPHRITRVQRAQWATRWCRSFASVFHWLMVSRRWRLLESSHRGSSTEAITGREERNCLPMQSCAGE